MSVDFDYHQWEDFFLWMREKKTGCASEKKIQERRRKKN
jgi:hypothetical protein